MEYMFHCARQFNQPLDRWNLAAIKCINFMFEKTQAFNQPLQSWNVAAINRKNRVFEEALAMNQPETLTAWRAAGYTD